MYKYFYRLGSSSMLFKNILKIIFLLITILINNGCAPGSKVCKYDSIEAYAVVKEIKKDHVILILSAKYAFFATGIDKDKEIILSLRSLDIDAKIPIYMEVINQGSCTPTGYRYR